MLGSAAIAVFMDARLAAEGLHFSASEGGGTGQLPAQVLAPFSSAMSDSDPAPGRGGAGRPGRGLVLRAPAARGVRRDRDR